MTVIETLRQTLPVGVACQLFRDGHMEIDLGPGVSLEVIENWGRIAVKATGGIDFTVISPPLKTPGFNPTTWFIAEVVGPLQRGEIR